MDHVIRSVIRISGIMMLVLGPAMVLTFIVSAISGECREGLPFLWIGFIVFLVGFLSRSLCKIRSHKLHIGDGFFIVSILWIVMSLIGALPYLLLGICDNFSAACFESTSGFTTTGATILDEINHLPHGILFWRAMTGWLGGVGILLIAITFMPALGLNGQRLNTPDNYGPVIEKISPRMTDQLNTIITIYTGMTLLETLLLKLCGMTLFNALIHSMSTISTCGFSRYDDGIAHFGGIGISLIISLFMIASGVNYHLLLHRPKNGLRNFLRSSEMHLYGILLGASVLLISTSLHLHYKDMGFGQFVTDALFQSASFLSTTGYYNADYCHWPQFPQMILLLLMFCGACTASPGGGIKVARLSILLKLVRHGVSTRLHANFFETVRMNGQGMGTDAVSGVATMPFLFLFALFTGTFLLTFDDASLSASFNAAIACLCNTGHSFGTMGLGGTFVSFSSVSKCLLSLLMIVGRLEVYAIIILLSPKFWTQNH